MTRSVVTQASCSRLEAEHDSQAAYVGGLFERFAAPLRKYLRRMLPKAADVDDVLQESYARLLEVDGLEQCDGRARAYLYRVATNLAIDRYRRRGAGNADLLDADAIESDAPTPEEIVELGQGLVAVKQVLLELTPRCRRVFLLRVSAELPYGDIARRLRISKRTVEREMRHALDKCQSRLKGSADPLQGR